ncbi:putative protein [Geobacter sp. OR-1]|uniref:DUF2703 domain-containing protein n=1 Tax=Geobacter sp. OR-1 TaxID=1266765 RepID=UPI0005423C14|nr:DUF2703 domain-containing protein [Geobacter sp. OR-1]GAM08327.1 putative protein [Geobacter sp. OR-1]
MEELTIEWRHYDKDGATCDRCTATGSSVKEVMAELTNELAGKGITVAFIETKLPEEQMVQSNLVLFNGVPLEEVLDNAAADESHCSSCSCMTGSETTCRTVAYEGEIHEEIPADLIRLAAYKALGLDQK